MTRCWFAPLLLLCVSFPAAAAPSIVEPVGPDVLLVRDDAGVWGGTSTGMTHQRGPDYWAKKRLDLSAVPEDFWKTATQVRLSVYFAVRDYSSHDAPKANGLDEAIEIVVNGTPHKVATGAGLPEYLDSVPAERCFRWHDFEIPKQQLIRGVNEIIFRLAPPAGKKPDDYLYLGIDNGVPGGNSQARFGKDSPWRDDQITVPEGGKGEYMVRLYLLRGQRQRRAIWRPGTAPEDPAGLIQYAGSHGPTTRIEWDSSRLDRLALLSLVIQTGQSSAFSWSWLDEQGKAVAPANDGQGPRSEIRLAPPWKLVPGGIELPKNVLLESIELEASEDHHPRPRRINMAPAIAPAAGKRADRQAQCQVEGDVARLANATLRCEFRKVENRLRLASLFNELAAAEVVRRSGDCALGLLEIEGKRFALSHDFLCRSLAPLKDNRGFTAALFCEPVQLEATFSAWIDEDLHLSLGVVNRGQRPLDFKLAFPHLAGLAVSENPADDYYFFPWGGGIIADAPAIVRRGYGDHEAIYQVMDLFSPARGAGLAVWTADADGRHKVLALRKHVPGQSEINGDMARTPTAAEYRWTKSLGPVPGLSLTYEYLRRTRQPGESFVAHEAQLRAHAGDWHAAMQAYSDWCRRHWQFRPYPSRLGSVHSMIARGWGQDVLFRDGKYREDVVQPRSDCVELMSWWEWSPLGPWGTPIDQVEKKLGLAKYKQWDSYFAKDPVTGKLMFNNNPGDYDGYNERWGGLPALRKAIQSYQRTGALVTLYTDPFRVDGNSRLGQKQGRLWGVVEPDGKHRDDYDAWRMCHDVAEYRQWTAEAMKRVLEETGADGIRLDEYGHAGSACFSRLHKHTYAEWGTTQWQRGVTEATRLVRQAMDQVKPEAVLTTEHPGYDFMFPWIEGCITYDLSVQATPLRPLECNLQRFYFPECKAYELCPDPQRFDPLYRKRFWNAVGSFGGHYPWPMYQVFQENMDVFQSRDCQALVPTLVPQVYANRFQYETSRTRLSKTCYTLYNATGHSLSGPMIELEVRPDQHVVDLLQGREAKRTISGGKSQVECYLPRDGVACLAVLPSWITVRAAGDLFEVTLSEPPPIWQLVACDRQGRPLWLGSLSDKWLGVKPFRLRRSDFGPNAAQAACLKLVEGGRLIDVAPLGTQ